MRTFWAAALIAATACAGPAWAQQTSPAPDPKPAEDSMPPKQSEDAQMSGPAESTPGGIVEPLPRSGAIVRGADPGAILALAGAGGDARLVTDDVGDPLIEAIAGNRPYTIAFFECTQNRDCQSVMFRAGFRSKGQTPGQMADWNREQRFGKAYLDAAGNPVVEFNVNLTGGVSRANLADSVDRWQAVLAGFAEHVGY